MVRHAAIPSDSPMVLIAKSPEFFRIFLQAIIK
jgi:hypothetical protein